MKKTFSFLALACILVSFKHSTTDVHPLIVTLYERMVLYQNCQNLVGTSIPTLDNDYKPIFSIDNGYAFPTQKMGGVTLYPTRIENCTLTITSQGKERGQCTFTVLPVPAPIAFLVNQNFKEISIAEPVKKGSYRLIAHSDANFLNTLPKEAAYRINKIILNIYRNGQKISTKRYTNETMPFDLNNTTAGDMVQVITIKAQRIGSQGELFDVIPTNPVINFMVKD
jgi:hypothetical protein